MFALAFRVVDSPENPNKPSPSPEIPSEPAPTPEIPEQAPGLDPESPKPELGQDPKKPDESLPPHEPDMPKQPQIKARARIAKPTKQLDVAARA